MPPIIAFCLCLAFVMTLLRLDAKHFKTWSMAGWVVTCWILYCGSRPVSMWFMASNPGLEFAIIEGSPLDRNFLTALMIVGLVILWRRKIAWHKIILDNRWLFLFFLYMLISVLWSDSQFVSLKRWVKAFGTIVMALVVVTGQSPLKEFEAILRRTVYILIPFSALLVKYFPQFGVKWGRYSGETIWAGVAMGKNSLGILCGIAIFFLLWIFFKTRESRLEYTTKLEAVGHFFILGMAVWLLKGPQGAYSATTVVILILGIIVLFLLRRKNTSKHLFTGVWMIIAVIGLVCLCLKVFFAATPLSIIINLTGHDVTLSGRADVIWPQLLSVAFQQPILGLGYGGYWLEPLQLDKFTINQAHNGYLEIFLELGFVGLIIFTILIVMFFKKAIDEMQYDIEWGSFRISLLLMVLLQNYTESTFIKSTAFSWNILIILMVVGPTISSQRAIPSSGED